MKRQVWTMLLVGGTLAWSARAEPTKAEIAVARQYFEAATAAENQGRWRDAIDQLTKAVAIKETAGLRYHLGFAKENLGMLVDAMLEYQRASGLIHSGMSSEEVERFIVPKLEEMRKRVPTLTVTLPPDTKGAQLQIDGATVKPELLGAPIPLNPGTHALVVFAPGRRPFHVQVTVSEGSAVTQAAELVPEVGGSAGPPPTATSSPAIPPKDSVEKSPGEASSAARTWVLIGEGAVTLAGLGIGLGYLVAASSEQTRFEDASAHVSASQNASPCTNPDPSLQADCDILSTSLDNRHRDKNIAAAGFIGAGVGAAALVATLLVWKSPNGSSDSGSTRFAVHPQVGRNTGGLSLRWIF